MDEPADDFSNILASSREGRYLFAGTFGAAGLFISAFVQRAAAFSRVTDAAFLPEGEHEARWLAIGRWSAQPSQPLIVAQCSLASSQVHCTRNPLPVYTRSARLSRTRAAQWRRECHARKGLRNRCSYPRNVTDKRSHLQ